MNSMARFLTAAEYGPKTTEATEGIARMRAAGFHGKAWHPRASGDRVIRRGPRSAVGYGEWKPC